MPDRPRRPRGASASPAPAPTLRTIAERCAVSTWTVSQALRDDPRVAAATRARVRACAASLGYDAGAHEPARRMAMRRHGRQSINRVVAVLLPVGHVRIRYFARMFDGLLDRLSACGIAAVTAVADQIQGLKGDDSDDAALPPAFSRCEPDGLVLIDSASSGILPLVRALRRHPGFGQRPIVSLMSPDPSCSEIEIDDFGAGQLMADHLLDLGHRHVLRLDVPHHPTQCHRWRAFEEAFARRGLDPANHIHVMTLPHGWADPLFEAASDDQGGTAAVLAELRRRPRITAIAGINDATAINAWHRLRAAGLDLPGRYSVIGHDDTDALLDDAQRNILTTIVVPLEGCGRAAADLLLARIHGRVPDHQVVTLPVSLTVRSSTAPAARL